MSVFVQQQGTFCDFSGGDSWVILSPIEQSIKRKIEAVGTPLKDWDIQINYGIKTGYNEAFIISTEKRNEILANCQTQEERSRTEELIRPILRGRDIKRYGYDWANLWLINAHNGVKGKFPRIDINKYPAVKAHLDQHWDKISTRADKGETPYNLRNCAYMEEFFKPKIMFQEIVQNSSFMLDTKGLFLCNDTGRIVTGSDIEYLIGILNSKLFFYAVKTFYGGGLLGENGIRMKHTFFENFRCAPVNIEVVNLSKTLIHSQSKEIEIEKELDNLIYSIYNLTADEIDCITESL